MHQTPAATDAIAEDRSARALSTHRLVRSVVETFLLVASDQVDEAIEASLARLGEGLDVDRTYTFRFHDGVCDNTHEWCGPGISPEIDNLQGVPNHIIEPWLAPFERGEHVFIADVDALPPERCAEREMLGLAEDFDMLALAEGVETEAQRQALDDAGCSLAQGFHFAPPMTEEAFGALLASPAQRCLLTAVRSLGQQPSAAHLERRG